MQLTSFTDYSLRVLIYLALYQNKTCNVDEIVSSFSLSKNHIIKVVHNLVKLGYVKSTRGRGGGLKLARSPAKINIGKIVESVEPNFFIAECFNKESNYCKISPSCNLKKLLNEAQGSFLDTLYKSSLENLIENKENSLKKLLS